MVFAIGLAVVTVLAPASSVVTAPLLTNVASGTAGAAAGTAAGLATSAAGAATASAAGAATAGTAAGTIAIKASAGVTGGLLTGANIAIGPPGWIALGAEYRCPSGTDHGNISGTEYSWTCWKKIIHDNGDSKDAVPLSYIFQHENVHSVADCGDHYIVENVWGENFKIYYVKLPNGEIAAHAE